MVYRLRFATVFHRDLGWTQRSPPQRGEQKGRCDFLLSFTAVQNWHWASHKRTSSDHRQHSADVCSTNLCSQTEIWFSKNPRLPRSHKAWTLLTTFHTWLWPVMSKLLNWYLFLRKCYQFSILVVLRWRLACLLNRIKLATLMSVWPGDIFFLFHLPQPITNTFQNSTIAGHTPGHTPFSPSCWAIF